jgi:hypothetical protein
MLHSSWEMETSPAGGRGHVRDRRPVTAYPPRAISVPARLCGVAGASEGRRGHGRGAAVSVDPERQIGYPLIL